MYNEIPKLIQEVTMSLTDYTLDGTVAIVRLNSDDNKLKPAFLDSFLKTLDDIEQSTNANALVVTSSHDKIFSNGLDLDWVVPTINSGNLAEFTEFIIGLMKLYRRILMFPMPTVAAVNGHAFAGGAILTCYFDYRFMRSDRGFLCFPEVDLGIPFLPGMMAAMRHVIPVSVLTGMLLEGRRLTGSECAEKNIAIRALPNETLFDEALAFAKTINKRREIIFEIKRELYKDILYAMDVEDPKTIASGRFNV
jgi:Delta3-Delta2-enoyl-CoA isomerase